MKFMETLSEAAEIDKGEGVQSMESKDLARDQATEAIAVGHRAQVGRLALAVPPEKDRDEERQRYLAQHPELWLSGF